MSDKVNVKQEDLNAFIEELQKTKKKLKNKVNVDSEKVEQGLAKLVLTLIELLRKLMEKQACRGIEGNSLSDDEIERLGNTFIKLEEKMKELREIFGLKKEDLNLDLGPLGDLM